MPLRICIVALNAYPAIESRATGVFGGIETRAWMFARGIARLPDCEVHLIVRTPSPLFESQKEGVFLHRLHDPSYEIRESLAVRYPRVSNFPYVQFSQPRLNDLWNLPRMVARRLMRKLFHDINDVRLQNSLKLIPADVYLTFGVQGTSLQTILAAHDTHKPVALFTGCDLDLDPGFLAKPPQNGLSGDPAEHCIRMIREADVLLCQTPAQQQLAQAFDKTAIVIQNPLDLEDWNRRSTQQLSLTLCEGLDRYVLWIGRADGVLKRPQEFAELARMTPEIPFLMILNKRDDAVELEVRNAAPDNLKIVEHVAFEQIPALMRNAKVLVNTSVKEGFPNVFLQAAASGVPVASLNVEGDFLIRTGIGQCADGDITRLREIVREYWQQDEQNLEKKLKRQRLQEYLQTTHDLSHTSQRLYHVLEQLVRTRETATHAS